MAFVRFGLIVTGKGEREFLPKLFRAVMGAATCTFEVIRKSEQLSPITSQKRRLRMGRGRIPTIDEEQFGLPALKFLKENASSFVIVIDDLEESRCHQADAVFARYRTALDEVLGRLDLSSRAAVHFLVNMLEAYYFAHSDAVNRAADFAVLESDYPTDVESISHPKNQLKRCWNGFNERRDGSDVLAALDLKHVLRKPTECCWLRTMVAWCVRRLADQNAIVDEKIHELFELPNGCRAELTAAQ